MLQVILGADDHTATEGSYLRAVKARKWVYLATALCALLAHRLYVEPAANDLLKVVEVPYWFVSQAVGLGLAYLTLQYAILLVQVRSVYDLELDERFAAKLKSEREKASGTVESAATHLRSVDREIADLEEQLEQVHSGFSEGSISALEAQLQAVTANRYGAAQMLDDATERLGSVEIRDPAKRRMFVLTEKLIDGLRLCVPIIAAAAALIGLVLAQF